MGCRLAQGYHLGRPAAPDEAVMLLEAPLAAAAGA